MTKMRHEMNPKGENRMVWTFFVVFIAIIVISLLFGCKTKTITVTETEHIHDTVWSVKADTVREVKITHHTDTVKQIESHTYTLNNVGDTVKEIHHYHDIMRTIVVDSTERYKSVVDSLRKALAVEKSKSKEVVKKDTIPWWWKGMLVLGILIICVMILKSRTK